MTYWDWIRVVNLVLLVSLIATQARRYQAGAVTVNPRLLLTDPSHLPLLRMGQILVFLALVEGNIEGLITDLPGGPRIIAITPGLLLTLLAMHWGAIHDAWRRLRPHYPLA